MTATTTAKRRTSLAALTGTRREALRAECARLADEHDEVFGVRLLAGTPTHEGREPASLRRWASAAAEFGTELAASADPAGLPAPHVVERTGGIEQLVLAKYVSRPKPAVELFTDTLAIGEELIDLLGWRAWYPDGALRAAALAHEDAHRLLHDAAAKRALRARIGHTALRLGKFRVTAYVAGADELAAHGYATARCGLGRSTLLLTAGLASAVGALGKG